MRDYFPEIELSEKESKEKNYDGPETEKKDNDRKIFAREYCFGFGVDKKENIYYVMGKDDGETSAKMEYCIVCLNLGKRDKRKTVYQYKNQRLQLGPIVVDKKQNVFAIGRTNEKTFLFPL